MKKTLLFLFLCLTGIPVYAQQDVIYDEAKVPSYVLPVLLSTDEAQTIYTARQWETIRRPQLLRQFAELVYGQTPGEEVQASYEELSLRPEALDGLATCKQLKITLSRNGVKREALLLLYRPNRVQTKVPVFLSYNYMGNQSVDTDPAIIPSAHTDAKSRGRQQSRWPLTQILSAGYGVATLCYRDIFPDAQGKQDESILPLFGYTSPTDTRPDSWQAIGAWAWGLSRVMDYLETDPRVNAAQVILMGHSRHGKAALWAGAQDERFAIVISNESGCGGAALSKRTYGETVKRITTQFPHWFCTNFNRFADNEQALPVDQHELLALIAPRPLYVASAEGDQWADPRGEYLGAYYAGEVYKLYGMEGLPSAAMPAVNSPVMNQVGYHIRSGNHDVTAYDWTQYIRFADQWLKGERQ